ncbi:MAG: acyl-CoA dehydratase activase-related protein [Oscillospiraceae bacterium]|nr:acyl-CoA dehydratase activase-related protein [Oscillospiraceae bacterium]
MTIGIPRALAYHRYGTLWETFFEELGIPHIVSPETNQTLLAEGIKHTVDESCLPLKLYMGHAHALLDRCDALLVPRLERLGKRDEFCVRFWGLPDTVRATFQDVPLLTYDRTSARPDSEKRAFLQIAKSLGKNYRAAANAYRAAQNRQREADFQRLAQNRPLLRAKAPKILIAAQSYIAHDPRLGGEVISLIRDLGAAPICIEAFDRTACHKAAQHISTDLYWTLSREILGAIHLARGRADGVILLTAFPCGSDCLANELVLRRVKDLPVIQILLDEHQSREGLATRIESFLDMVTCRGGVIPPASPRRNHL